MIRLINNQLSPAFRYLLDEPEGTFICVACSILGLLCLLFWTIWLQATGSIPCEHGIYFVWWHWSLPFGVSRLWDP